MGDTSSVERAIAFSKPSHRRELTSIEVNVLHAEELTPIKLASFSRVFTVINAPDT